MFEITKTNKVTFIIIAIWIVAFLAINQFNLLFYLSGKGINKIEHGYHRFLTAPLLHQNLVHLLVNVAAMYWVGYFLEKNIGGVKFLLFGLLACTLAEIGFSCIYKNSENIIGGSPYIFAFIGLIIVLQLFNPNFPKFRMFTWYGNWIVSYALLANLPIFPFVNSGTIVIHALALLAGFSLGLLCVFAGII